MSARRVVLFFGAIVVLALAGVAAAASTDPRIEIDPIDQAWAESIVLAPTDFNEGWTAEPTPEQDSDSDESESESWCAEGTPNRSDLTATGVASSPDFTRDDKLSVWSYSIVWQTPEQAQADWDRMITSMPSLINCFARLFSGSVQGIKIVVTAKGRLAFPAVTSRTAAYRVKVAVETTVRVKKKRKKKLLPLASLDFVLLGNGRASVMMMPLSLNPKPLSAALERSLAEKMAARMASDPTAPPAP
jgi:hypothetical protein